MKKLILLFLIIPTILSSELQNLLDTQSNTIVVEPVSPNGKFVLTVSDCIAQVWKKDTGKYICTVELNKPIVRAGFNSDKMFSLYYDTNHSTFEQIVFYPFTSGGCVWKKYQKLKINDFSHEVILD